MAALHSFIIVFTFLLMLMHISRAYAAPLQADQQPVPDRSCLTVTVTVPPVRYSSSTETIPLSSESIDSLLSAAPGLQAPSRNLPSPTQASTPFVSSSLFSSFRTSSSSSGEYIPYQTTDSVISLIVTIPFVQSLPGSVQAYTFGSINSIIPISGATPFPDIVIQPPFEALSPIQPPTPSLSYQPALSTVISSMPLFVSMTAGGPPDQVTRRAAHPVARKGINDSPSKVIPTNNFYGNLMLGNQNQGVWTHPYSLRWVKGTGNSSSWGFGVSHIERSQFAYGPGNPNKYFIAPLGITSIILSAQELSNSTALTTDSLEAFSVNANLAVSAQSGPLVTFPLVQGMGFFTGVYLGATALIQTDVFFRTLSGPWTLGTSLKYKVLLEDGRTWLFYVHSSQGYVNPQFILRSNTTIQGPSGFRGSIQVAKLPEGQSNAESWYDWAAGVYPVTGATFGTFNNGSASYTLSWQKGGDTGKTLIMWALPHHIQSFNGGVGAAATDVQLYTTTKGQATLVASDQWVMVEKLVTDMGFTPWTPQNRSVTTLPEKAIVAINSVASSELNQDFAPQTNLDSMYFSGKGLAKFAAILIAVNDLARNPGLAAAGLSKLKTAFNNFVQNTQKSPLVYDQIFKGVISTAGYSDPGADFGNTYYNDHHFHYGYFVYTAAVIAHLDPSWLNQGTNLQWVQTLVQDFASPVADERFPFSRAFDWFHGHSWAKGLFESADGKDQESTSEDAFASYALKLWGRVIGDAALEARGDLMLAIQARTFQNYFLMDSSNKIQPASFIENKVTGILFENKVDHATYFSADIECIQGIHMIPIMPPSTLIRSKAFVTEEWNKYFSNGRVDSIPGGWRGILYANLAIINPKASYDFFAQPNFDPSWLDGGASRTWYLAYAAALGGCT